MYGHYDIEQMFCQPEIQTCFPNRQEGWMRRTAVVLFIRLNELAYHMILTKKEVIQ